MSVLSVRIGAALIAVIPRGSPTAMAACAGCTASWRRMRRPHCRVCRVTCDDEVLFDVYRRTRPCVTPDRFVRQHALDLGVRMPDSIRRRVLPSHFTSGGPARALATARKAVVQQRPARCTF